MLTGNYQDQYGKLLDSCVVYVGRSADQGSWIRRSTKESVLSTNSGRESPAPRQGKCSLIRMPDILTNLISRFRRRKTWAQCNKSSSRVNSVEFTRSGRTSASFLCIPMHFIKLLQITTFVATSTLPNLRRLLMENDKIISACNNIIYYIVNPNMRGKTRSSFVMSLHSPLSAKFFSIDLWT